MGSVKVTVFGRIKPQPKNSLCQEYKLKYGDHEDQITFAATKTTGKRVFRFRKLFDEDATQEQIFEAVAKPVIKSVFSGYNGTIFTYGQTGSGKTHTMTGSLEKWVDTGLIPRSVQEIFEMKETDTVITITFFEIYNEHIYDLIKNSQFDSEETQVSFLDDNTGITNFRNLSSHVVKSAYEALQLYRRGDANKMVAETNSNARSSRSHVIFSIGLEFPHPKEERLCLKPVLHLVDLAGSERLSKSKNPMTNPWETRYINLSLHYLEQVLIALRQPGRVHIPYRNSLMTALLKNSLGGNCVTAMIATLSLSLSDLDETMQTCRFAERIALIKNELKLSEISNPQREIELLKRENERLKQQIKLLSSEQVTDNLGEKEKEKCYEMVKGFLQGDDFFELPLTDIRRMEYCFHLMRQEVLKRQEILKRQRYDTINLKCISDGIEMTKSDIWEVIPVRSDEKVLRNKRSPFEIPKINITYKKVKSVELLSDKENTEPLQNYVTSRRETASKAVEVSLEDAEKIQSKKSEISNIKNPSFLETNMRQINSMSLHGKERKNVETVKSRHTFGFKFPGESNAESIKLIQDVIPKLTSDSSINNVADIQCSEHKLSRSKRFFFGKLKKRINVGVQIDEGVISESEKSRTLEKILSCDQFSAKNLPLTGDKEVDEEIIKFYKLRYQMLKNE